MDKVLPLYIIRDFPYLTRIKGWDSEFNADTANIGELYLGVDGPEHILYKCIQVLDELDLDNITPDQGKRYIMTSDGVPMCFEAQSNGRLTSYDISFPLNTNRKAHLTSFTYSATRMNNAPAISGTLMYRECLDERWTDEVCVYFNKMFFFIDKTPTSEYSNTDERYKHSCEFVSERKLLENVYFTNVVDIENYEGDVAKLPMQWLEFSFYGDIDQFISRLNLSLEYSKLDEQHVGFKVVKDNIGDVEPKMINISNTTLKGALDMIYETWNVPYWFDGYTIHIGYSNTDAMTEDGVEMPTFQYGAVQSLLSIQKNQNNDIINRITGLGSSENVPYFYPNKNPNGIELQYLRDGDIMTDYARIANPYRTVKLEASDEVVDGVPTGSYFKYMRIDKTYTYDQLVAINPHEQNTIQKLENEPQLVLSKVQQEDFIMRFFHCNGGLASQHLQVKAAWLWIGDDNTNESIVIEDKWCLPSVVDGIVTGPRDNEAFPNYRKGYVLAQSFVKSKEQFTADAYSINDINLNLINGFNLLNLTYSKNNDVISWSDGTTTSTYEDKMPLTISSIPASATCVLFVFARATTQNDTDSNGYNNYNEWLAAIETDTKTILKYHFSSAPDWSLNGDGHATHLFLYGIRLNQGITPIEGDIIYFTKEAGALPCFGQILPYSFRETLDIWLDALNLEYLKEGSQNEYYHFQNVYRFSSAKEHVENFDDIKPTIKGMTNNETPAKRIDKILAVAFDQNDTNDLSENGKDYQHPYFFVKLAKTSLDDGYSFNLFDCAIEGETMQINMTSGNNGGCVFDVMVKYQTDGVSYNPVGVFTEPTTINGVTYPAGSPRRNLQTGDVLVNRKEDIQQDTSAAEVWIALLKDNKTFGKYDNGNAVVLPDSTQGTNFIPAAGDTFVLTNISLPYAYVVAAEKKLYYALLDYMEEHNPRKWSFSIKFSSIYYKKHYEFMDKWLNESSRMPFIYNNITRNYYVQSYSYKMSENVPLPEVAITLEEEVKKHNKYVVVPSVTPTPQNPAQELQKYLSQNMKMLSDTTPQSYDVNNLQVAGDITLQDGTSLNAQILALNSSIFANGRIQSRENTWSKVSLPTEAKNMFVDGLFNTLYNTFKTTDARIVQGATTFSDGSSVSVSFASTSSNVIFDQKIACEEGTTYTVSFFAKAAQAVAMGAFIHFYNASDTLVSSSERVKFYVDTEWRQFAFIGTAPSNARYFIIEFNNGAGDVNILIDISGIMVFNQNFTTFDQNGNVVPSVLLPEKYRHNAKEFVPYGRGLPDITSSDEGSVLKVSNGSWVKVSTISVYSGTTTPSSSVGQNGDIYIQTS